MISFNGSAGQTIDKLPFFTTNESTAGATLISSNGRKNAAATRGHDYSLRGPSGANAARYAFAPRKAIPWEEVLVEAALYFTAASSNNQWSLHNVTSRATAVRITGLGQVIHYTGGTYSLTAVGTVQGSTGLGAIPSGQWAWLSHHTRIAGGTSGFMRTWIDSLTTPVLDTPGINTQGSGVTEADTLYYFTNFSGETTQWLMRPICITVDGVASGTPSIGGTIAGTTESAEVYAWESQTDDSEGLGGDPELAADEVRLFLRALSFSPADSGATGWANNESVTVTGLTGTLLVNAPHAAYRKGMEPGSTLLGRNLYVERLQANATGTNNADGSLGGGATDRLDALDTLDDGLYVQHTAAAEKVTVNVEPIANQSSVDEVLGVLVVAQALSDGAAPNAIRPLMLDNATQLGGSADAEVLAASNTTVTHAFQSTAAGGQWTKGAGAGGLDQVEVGYETDTV